MTETREFDKRRLDDGVLWIDGTQVYVLTSNAFATTGLGTNLDAEDLVRKLNDSGDMSPLGMVRKEAKLDDLSRLAILKEPSALVFGKRQWYKEGISLLVPFEIAKEIYQGVRQHLGDRCEEVTGKASVFDVPLHPGVLGAVALALLAFVCMLGGAYEPNAQGRMPAIAWLFFFVGWLVGPWISIGLGVLVLAGAVFALVRSLSNLPKKRELRVREAAMGGG